MKATIVETPFRTSLVGMRGTVDGGCFGAVGKQLMDRMWAEVRDLHIRNTGINHWVYLPESQLFTGVQLAGPCDQLGALEPLDVSLDRYLQYVHKGLYSELPAVWQKLRDQLHRQDETLVAPALEIYGHWHEDPQQCETTILIGLADRR